MTQICTSRKMYTEKSFAFRITLVVLVSTGVNAVLPSSLTRDINLPDLSLNMRYISSEWRADELSRSFCDRYLKLFMSRRYTDAPSLYELKLNERIKLEEEMFEYLIAHTKDREPEYDSDEEAEEAGYEANEDEEYSNYPRFVAEVGSCLNQDIEKMKGLS